MTPVHFPEPQIAATPDPDDGPVMVTAEWRIDPAERVAFTAAMAALRRARRRDGAIRHGVWYDLNDPSRVVENYVVQSWAEHLRQRERATEADRAAWLHARGFHQGEDGVLRALAPAAARRPDGDAAVAYRAGLAFGRRRGRPKPLNATGRFQPKPSIVCRRFHVRGHRPLRTRAGQLERARRFINTVNHLHAREYLPDGGEFRRICLELGLPDPGRVTAPQLARVKEVREALRALAAAHNDGPVRAVHGRARAAGATERPAGLVRR